MLEMEKDDWNSVSDIFLSVWNMSLPRLPTRELSLDQLNCGTGKAFTPHCISTLSPTLAATLMSVVWLRMRGLCSTLSRTLLSSLPAELVKTQEYWPASPGRTCWFLSLAWPVKWRLEMRVTGWSVSRDRAVLLTV